jgi:urease accessory protein
MRIDRELQATSSRQPAPRADAAPGDAWRAAIELEYVARGGRTVPGLRRHHGPLRVQRGLLPEGPGVWHQILVHPPGGIASNDSLEIDVTARAGARALLTSPGAAKWYRARRPASPLAETDTWARQSLRVRVEAGASVEWLPLESIVFAGARAQWTNRFEVEPGGVLLAAELACLGEPASARAFDAGCLRWRTEIRRGDRLLYAERASLAGGDRILQSRAGLDGHPVFGTLFVVAADPDTDPLPLLRAIEAPGEHAATRVDELSILRWRGRSVEEGWLALRAAWSAIRPALLGRAPVAPRIWAT